MQLVFSSTCAVYGNPNELPVTEATPTNPINPYGKAKLAAEEVLRDYAASDSNFRAVVLRYFNVYGSDPDGLIGEYSSPTLRQYSRISGACMDAAQDDNVKLKITGVA
jgi:UDP-arabinose 4-epimerase